MTWVVYRDITGWFRWATAKWWDDPTYKLDGQRVDTREEIARYPTQREAREVRDLYNQMVHGQPSDNELYNHALMQRRISDETT